MTEESFQTPAASQPIFESHPSPEERELIRLSHAWMELALVHRDERALRELMSPEFSLQIWDASRSPQPLEAWLGMLHQRLEVAAFEYFGINARVFGHLGVVYSRFRWKGTLDGSPFQDAGFMTDVWIRQHGRWQVLSRRSAGRQQIAALEESA